MIDVRSPLAAEAPRTSLSNAGVFAHTSSARFNDFKAVKAP
jgi:hypothetical protein